MPKKRAPRKHERGYALLLVLFMGALVAIGLALSLPRAALESQRAKEDVLIYRGSQYSRAVQLYFRKFRKYPGSLDDLEKTNNVRFLRRRYTDPITKSDEWRIVHIGPAGVFTDSLVYDRPKKNPDGTTQTGAATASSSPFGPTASPDTSGAAQAGAAGQTATGMADRLRFNNAGLQQPADPNAPQGQPTYFNQGQPGAYGQPGAQPGNPYAAGQPGQPGIQNVYNQGQPGVPGTGPYSGGATAASGFANQGFPGNPSAQSPYGAPNTAGYPPAGGASGAAAGIVGGAVGSEAARIIGQLLTTPRPGGLAGLPGGGFNQPGGAFGGQNAGFAGGSTFGGQGGSAFSGTGGSFGTPAGSTTTGPGGAVFGGGIAGVASKSEARGIKVYKEREIYKEWEFVYDYRRDPALVGGGAAAAGAGAQTGQQGAGAAGAGTASAFGQPGASSFGSSTGQSSFGQTGFGQTGFGQSGPGQPAGQSGFGQPNPNQSGFGQPGGVQPGIVQPGIAQPGVVQPDNAQPNQPGQNPVAPVNPTQPSLGPGPIAVPSLPPLAVPAPPPPTQ